jgi:hypothetical protein
MTDFGFENHNIVAPLFQLISGNQTREACANYNDANLLGGVLGRDDPIEKPVARDGSRSGNQ